MKSTGLSGWAQRIMMLLLVAVMTPRTSHAQDSLDVLDWQSELTWNMVLIQEMHRQYEQRAEDFYRSTRSEAGARDYQARIKQRYDEIRGDLPALSPLNARVTGTIERDGYRIEKLLYESFPGHHVTANMYVPAGDGPFPAVLFFMGHEREAKATPSYQRTAILLARNGFVVLAIDPISQGERFQLVDADGNPLTRGGTTEHTLLGASSNLVGTDVVSYEYWDNRRGLDYLLSRPDVDTTRIGAVGNSGGATMLTYFVSLKDRVTVAAPSSYVTQRQRSLEVLGPQDACQWIPYEGLARLEIADFLLMNAPIATLTLAGKYDFVDFVGTERAHEELERFYTATGRPDHPRLFYWLDGHGITEPKREEAVRWFRQWFYDDPSPIEEGNLAVLDEQELQVTSGGQVAVAFADEYHIHERNIDLAESFSAARDSIFRTSSREAYRHLIDSVLHADIYQVRETTHEAVGRVHVAGHVLEKVVIRREGQVPVPALVRYPDAATDSRMTVLWFPDEGKRSVVLTEEAERVLQDEGVGVVIADLRGVGEMQDPAAYNDAKYYNREYRNDQISLHIGKPVVGQRVNDIVSVLDFVADAPRLAGASVELHASGLLASPALHAAVLDGRIDTLRLSDTVDSYMDILRNPTGKNWYAYVVPGAMKIYDLPDLMRFVGADRVEYRRTM